VIGSPLTQAIIERVRTGMPALGASNHENPLAVLECGGYDGRGAAPNARRRWWLEYIGSLISAGEHELCVIARAC
jgi:hypothetical protein